MSLTHPRLTPWRSQEELFQFKSLFYTTPNIIRALTKLKAYESKTSIPTIIKSTGQLFHVKQLFLSPNTDSTTLQLVSSMTIIKFVNGLLDPYQQSNYVIPLNLIAKKKGLPSWFVELRHLSTHDDELPSLEMLELAIDEGIRWLYENYWKFINEVDDNVVDDSDDVNENREKLKDLLKRFKSFRKNDSKFYKFGDSSESGVVYWGIIDGIVRLENFDWDLFIGKLIKGSNHSVLIKFYSQLVNHLELRQRGFKLQMFEKALFKTYDNEKNIKSKLSEEELKNIQSWIDWLSKEVDHDLLLDIIAKYKFPYSLELLKRLEVKNDTLLQSIILEIDQSVNQKRNIEIDDITNDLESLKKRIKLDETSDIKRFEPYENWEPKPFGVL